MSASIVMCGPGKSRRTTCRCGRIWTWKRPDWRQARSGSGARSVPAALHPVLEHLQPHGAVVVGGFGDRPVVAFLDPDLIRRGAVAGKGQPHQPARGLTRQPVAVEQHLAEHGLRLMLALLGGEPEPARAVAEIVP